MRMGQFQPNSTERGQCRLAFESRVPADAGHFLTNLLARARYRFISLFFFLYADGCCQRCRCKVLYSR